MTYYSTITSKDTITLPAEIRKRFGLKTGTRVGIVATNDQIVRVVPAADLEDLAVIRQHLTMQIKGVKPITNINKAFEKALYADRQ